MNIIVNSAKDTLRYFGINVSRTSSIPISPYLYHKINLIYDVGANDGGFAMLKRKEGYRNNIVSFEPLGQAYKALKNNALNDEKWKVHKRVAIGASEGATLINVSGNSYSSSLLPMLNTHLEAASESKYISNEDVEIITLDSIFKQYYHRGDTVAVKIDTQGYESQVLEGLERHFNDVALFQLELSIIPLYEKQELFEYFFDLFRKKNYAYQCRA